MDAEQLDTCKAKQTLQVLKKEYMLLSGKSSPPQSRHSVAIASDNILSLLSHCTTSVIFVLLTTGFFASIFSIFGDKSLQS